MRLLLARFAIALLALSVVAPALMAFQGCGTQCTADDEAGCGDADCCSCCPVVRSDGSEAAAACLLSPGGRCLPSDSLCAVDDLPRGILHVPRPPLA